MEDHSKLTLILCLVISIGSFLQKLRPNMVGNLKIQAWVYSLPILCHFFSCQCHPLRNVFPCWCLLLGFNHRHSQPLFCLTKKAMYFRFTEYRLSFFLVIWIICFKWGLEFSGVFRAGWPEFLCFHMNITMALLLPLFKEILQLANLKIVSAIFTGTDAWLSFMDE